MIAGTLGQRFWKYVQRGDGCWEWTGSRYKRYGCIRSSERPHRFLSAHRVSWEIANGPIPKGMVVCHRCDNGFCVRPDHLFLGTQIDNIRDMDAKGRRGNRKLTERQVRSARHRVSLGETQASVARDFGVTAGAISSALRGATWRHIS